MASALLVERVPEVTIKGEYVHFTEGDAGHFAMHIDVCRAMHRQITEALVVFDTKPLAKIYRIGKPKRH